MVTNEISQVTKTIRSRCSLVNFRAPSTAHAQAWLEQQNAIPHDEIGNYLSMANNHPLKAIEYFESNYVESLRQVLTDVNNLWNKSSNAIQVAKSWQEIGSLTSLDILQKLHSDILKHCLTDTPSTVFYPIQQPWIRKISKKLNKSKVIEAYDALVEAKKLVQTSVDDLLLLETVSNRVRTLPF